MKLERSVFCLNSSRGHGEIGRACCVRPPGLIPATNVFSSLGHEDVGTFFRRASNSEIVGLQLIQKIVLNINILGCAALLTDLNRHSLR